MTKKKLALTLLAVCLITVTAVVPAMAYFTAHKTAQGSLPVQLGTKTDIQETFDGINKIVTISNDESSDESVWVRVRAYAPDTFKGQAVTLEYSGKGWTQGEDGWYYYEKPLAPGEAIGDPEHMDPLTIAVNGLPEDAVKDDTFHVAVVYESAKVLYDEGGNELEADWEMKGETTEGGGNE